jgi:hypothetical protein
MLKSLAENELDLKDQADGDAPAEPEEEGAGPWLDADTKAFLTSFGVHTLVILFLAAAPIVTHPEVLGVILQASASKDELAEFEVESIAYTEMPSETIGANSLDGQAMALSTAPIISEISELPSPPVTDFHLDANLTISSQIREATGLTHAKDAVRGMTGVAATGTDGAVDRITFEILQSIEERPTLVAWLFDASVSLSRRREEIRKRFDRIYEELGIVQDQRRKNPSRTQLEGERLLTSVISFGEKIQMMTERPTADLTEIRDAIDAIQVDLSGVEKVFSALYLAADKYKSYRVSRGEKGPERNVLVIVVTDERGDDTQGLEKTIELCRKFAIPIHVLGVPAPFGREFTYVKYVDPDPKFDQTPQWAQIDQGPETLFPERIQLGYEDNYFEEPIIDSGFGPYALSRACYETGGIYFTIHPNRKFQQHVSRGQTDAFASHLSYFFDPEKMDRYRPDYVPEAEYVKRAQESPLRQRLIQAARLSRVGELDRPQTQFIKRDEAAFTNQLTQAQQESARLEPRLAQLCEILIDAEKMRDKELSPRWLASFDLSLGTALAAKVRNESYNLMLAKAKRGMKTEDPKNNTWILRASDEISVGSKLEKEAELATKLLRGVVDKHAGTPWALLAQRELDRKLGWEWRDSYTDLSPPPRRGNAGNNNNNRPAPANDQARMLEKPPTRPIPKL